MRVLILTRGAPGSGKSTFLRDKGLEPYTLSPDALRILAEPPTLNPSGKETISQDNDKFVWGLLFQLLEERMAKGALTVIDATHSKTNDIQKYRKRASYYRYRCFVLDFTDTPLDVCKAQNLQRPPLKQVPESVLENMYARFATQAVPSWAKVVKRDDLNQQVLTYRPMDLTNYDNVYIFGDVHGNWEVLKTTIESIGGIQEKNYHIFLGDYIDRGPDSNKVLEFIETIITQPNVACCEGNHEHWLWKWGNFVETKSGDFAETSKQLRDIGRARIRQLYRRLQQLVIFDYQDSRFFCSHGGFAYEFPVEGYHTRVIETSTHQFVKGVGRYEDTQAIHDTFEASVGSRNDYLVHAHRNIERTTIFPTPHTINLEGGVDRGREFRAVRICKDGIFPIVLANTWYVPHIQSEVNLDEVRIETAIEDFQRDRHVQVKALSVPDLVAVNFTRDAFHDKKWNERTVLARGLFINRKNNTIDARSYNKFFNVGERNAIRPYDMEGPIAAFMKYNGYLGIIGIDSNTGGLLFTSKSALGEYAEVFKTLFYSLPNAEETAEKLRVFLLEQNFSLVAEVLHEFDPHIIDRTENKFVVLDYIRRTLKFDKIKYPEAFELSKDFGFQHKALVAKLKDAEVLLPHVESVEDSMEPYEGVVYEDANGTMLKQKTRYYRTWKNLRFFLEVMKRGGRKLPTGSLLTPMENEVFGLMASIPKEELPPLTIIDIRRMYERRTQKD